ncbi:MAG: response regulator [Lachnospiraceae bacterium]|nr:response regulator [Lachnospiraceae bacterium]
MKVIEDFARFLYPARMYILVLLITLFLVYLFCKRGIKGRGRLTVIFFIALFIAIVTIALQGAVVMVGRDGIKPGNELAAKWLIRISTSFFVFLTTWFSIYINDVSALRNKKFVRTDLIMRGVWWVICDIEVLALLFFPMELPEGTEIVGAQGPYYYILIPLLILYIINMAVNMMVTSDFREGEEQYFYIINMFFAVYTILALFFVTKTQSLLLFECVAVVSVYIFIENLDKKEKEQYREEKLSADRANSAKSSFLANVSHEIRTPLNAIIGINEMISRDYKDDKLQEYSLDIRNASNVLLGIVNNLLDLGKIEAGKIQRSEKEFELGKLLNNVFLLMETRVLTKKIELVENVNPKTPGKLYGDAQKLGQIIANIGTNAIKYTEKGKVTITVDHEVPDPSKPIINLLVTVSDTGIGIREEDLPRVFEKFERVDRQKNSHVEGTGLGLSIVKQFLDLLGGTISVKSKYKEGTTFSVSIPFVAVDDTPVVLNRNREEEKAKLKATRNYNFNGKDILVVDDSVINLKVIRGLLEKTGAAIDSCTNGEDALELVRGKHYDVIFLDHMMPGMDGIETLKRMKSMTDNRSIRTPVVALTANALMGARDMYMAEGFSDYLSKPINVTDLFEMINRYNKNIV